jgi:hypothetical protein
MDVRFCEGRNHRREARVRAVGSARVRRARCSEARLRRIFFSLTKTGSKIALLMPDSLGVRLGSQGFLVSGPFVPYGVAWTFRTRQGRVPHTEHPYAKLSRSGDRGDAQSRRWQCLWSRRGIRFCTTWRQSTLKMTSICAGTQMAGPCESQSQVNRCLESRFS